MSGLALRPLHGLALCAGIGGLELGLKLALGDAYRCVGYVEREAFSASVLVARMEDAALDRAPIWDDLSTFDGKPWRGVVDLVSAGYPCQPFSVAGNRAGEADPRHLWPHVRRIIDEVEPGLVFLENVPGHLSLGFDSVLRDLAALGFDAEWCVLGADDVGAPHCRKRLWCLAYRDEFGLPCQRFAEHTGQQGARWRELDRHGSDRRINGPQLEHAPREHGGEGRERDAQATARRLGSAGEGMGDSRSSQRECVECEPRGRGPCDRGARLADAAVVGEREPDDEAGADAWDDARQGARWGGLWPPGPSDLHAWRTVQADTQPSLCRVAHGSSDRVDRLRALGNGVVPVAAAYAFRTLAARVMSDERKAVAA